MEVFLGFYFGVIAMNFLYNIHWYRLTQEKSYLYYAAFIAFMLTITLQNNQMLVINPFFIILNANIIFICLLLFSMEFLNLKKKFKKINMGFNAALCFIALCFAYFLYTGNYAIYAQPYSLIFSPLFFIGYYVYRSGFKPAKYYVIYQTISLSLVGIYDLNQFGVIDFYSFIPFDTVANLIGSIILSYAISVRTNLIVAEQEQQSRMLVHQSKLASMGQMLENISHQWRQPLNRIATFIINMKVHINDKFSDDEYLGEALNQSQLQLEYMSNTLNDFTNFNKQTEDEEKFQVSSVIDAVVNIVEQTLRNHHIRLEIKMLNDFSVVSYPNELSQVVLNLIQNSQDVLFKRQVARPYILVIIDNNKISIIDNAGGIEADIVEKIFEPYFTTKSQASSLGLGLYMSKIILDKYFNAKLELQQDKITTCFSILFA